MFILQFAKIIVVVDYFRKILHRRCLTAFRIYQGSDYIYHSEHVRFLNLPVLHRLLNMSEYVWIITKYALCLTMPKYGGICVNMYKSTWMAFALHFRIVIPRSTWTRSYFSLCSRKTRNMRLFSWRDKI